MWCGVARRAQRSVGARRGQGTRSQAGGGALRPLINRVRASASGESVSLEIVGGFEVCVGGDKQMAPLPKLDAKI